MMALSTNQKIAIGGGIALLVLFVIAKMSNQSPVVAPTTDGGQQLPLVSAPVVPAVNPANAPQWIPSVSLPVQQIVSPGSQPPNGSGAASGGCDTCGGTPSFPRALASLGFDSSDVSIPSLTLMTPTQPLPGTLIREVQ